VSDEGLQSASVSEEQGGLEECGQARHRFLPRIHLGRALRKIHPSRTTRRPPAEVDPAMDGERRG
jgi:hypothetical protein